MRNLVGKIQCPECGHYYDPVLRECPYCKTKNDHFDAEYIGETLFWVNPSRQISLFLVLLLGLNIFASIFSVFFGSLDKTLGSLLINSLTYIVIFVFLIVLLLPNIKDLLKTFKNYKQYLWGLLAFASILLPISLTVSSIVQRSFALMYPGVDITANNNQNLLETITRSYPLPSLLIFGIVGPICEELGYRVGLFNFLKRFNNIIAYAISGVIFGFIHFNFLAPVGPELTYEFLIISNYIVAGILLAVIYDYFGLVACTTAHVCNNMLSLLLTVLVIQ